MTGLTPASGDALTTLSAEALRTRQHRAHVKQSLREGKVTVREVLNMGANGVGDPIIGRMPIRSVLLATPKWGPVKTDRLLYLLGVPGDKHLDKLTEKVRNSIADAVEFG
jgi:hypothetical protein